MIDLGAFVAAARPRQWTKNAVAAAGLVFSGQLLDPASQWAMVRLVICLCQASSCLYVLNDIADRDADRLHPVKRLRPIAAGRLSVPAAWGEAAVLGGAAALVASTLPWRAGVTVAAFMGLNALYTVVLKRFPVVDVTSIAVSFVLRVVAGVEAIGAPQSPWVVACMFFLALFLALAKRRGELRRLGAEAVHHRAALAGYTERRLDTVIAVSGSAAVASYVVYSARVHGLVFVLSAVPVAIGIWRYFTLVVDEGRGEDPGEILTRDAPLLATILGWGAVCVGLLYAAGR